MALNIISHLNPVICAEWHPLRDLHTDSVCRCVLDHKGVGIRDQLVLGQYSGVAMDDIHWTGCDAN